MMKHDMTACEVCGGMPSYAEWRCYSCLEEQLAEILSLRAETQVLRGLCQKAADYLDDLWQARDPAVMGEVVCRDCFGEYPDHNADCVGAPLVQRLLDAANGGAE